MTIKKSLITTDWRAKGLKGNPGTRSLRICFLLLIMLMVPVAVVSAAYIDSISPVTGSYIGGDQISIAGGDFNVGTTLINFSLSTSDGRIGGLQLTNVTRVSSILITAITPSGSPGVKYNLSMIGANTVNYPNAFTYQGSMPPTITGINGSVEMAYVSISGNSVINISGTLLGTATSATFGGTSNGTIPFIANDGINITMKAPARSATQTGIVTVSVNTPNGSASYRNLTYVGTPVITSVYPTYGSTFGGETITIIGTGDLSGATSVGFNSTNSVVPTRINSTAVSALSPLWPNNVKGATFINVTTTGGTSANSLFTFYDPPNIYPTNSNAISLNNGSYIGGSTVTILGTNFTAASAVKFNGTAATSFTVNSAGTSITAVVPAYATNVSKTMVWPAGNVLNVPVNVTTYDNVASGTTTNNYGNFSYEIQFPNVTSISPTSGSTSGGNMVTITGKNLSYASKVNFGMANLANTTAGITVVNDNTITCIVPMSTLIGAVVINVTTPYSLRSTDVSTTYSFTAVEPAITTVSPSFGSDQGGQWVNITGAGFSGATLVSFNGLSNGVPYVFNDTSITVLTPAYPLGGTSFVAVSAAGGSITKQNAYTFAGFPHITSISPIAGSIAGGNTVTITGTNLTGTSFVRFNTTPATSITVVSPTSVTAVIPAANGSASGPVTVNVSTYITDNTITKTYQSNPDNGGLNAYTYGSGPTLTSISPVSGAISGGTLVTLKGANLANATSVTFGGIPATNFTRFDAGNQITANTPSTTTPGLVNPLIITPAGSVTNASVGYTYYGSPVITSVSPSGGSIAGNTFVTITGTSFVGASQVTFDGIQATNFTYISDTKITANTPAHAAGVVTVLVAATGGTGTGSYTYGSTPVTATAVGVFRSGTFYLNGGTPVAYGLATDTPITGNWNGGSTTNVGVFRSGTFYLNGGTPVAYGLATDTPITGVWTAGSATNVGVFRSGTFYLNGGTPVAYGLATDTPVTGDWNGDGITEVGVFRSGTFYLNGVTTPVAYGLATDTPITGDWNADGITEVGVFRSGTFYLNGVTTPVAYGLATDTPITGKWV